MIEKRLVSCIFSTPEQNVVGMHVLESRPGRLTSAVKVTERENTCVELSEAGQQAYFRGWFAIILTKRPNVWHVPPTS